MIAEIERALRERGARFEVLHHSRAPGGIQEAVALGLDPDDVLKAVVLETRAGHALAVLPADRRVSMDRIREATGDRHCRLATEDEIERDLPEWELGAVPPLGSLVHVPVYVDPEVLRHPVVAFAAGTQTESIKGSCAELFEGEMMTITPIAERPEDRSHEDY